MDQKLIYRLFNFLKHKEEREIPFIVKLLYAPETLRPEDLNIEHDLHLDGNYGKNITTFPESVNINGDLSIVSFKKFKTLPNILTVSGILNISNSSVKVIPPTISVGSLNISGTKIKEIPENLNKFRLLNVKNTQLTKLPEELSCSSLDISSTEITKLPDNFIMCNRLNFSNSKLIKIPSGFNTMDLIGYDCQLELIGENVVISNDCSIYSDKSYNNRINGNQLQIGENFKVGRNLTIRHFESVFLPKKFSVGRNLSIINVGKLSPLPDNFTVLNLSLPYINLTKLPNNLTVNGVLDIRSTNIDDIPYNLKVHDDLNIRNTPLSDKFNEQTIRKMIIDRGGFVRGSIYHSGSVGNP